MASIAVFLELNGYELLAEKADAINTILDLAAGKLNQAALAAWIRRNSRRMRNK